MAFRHLDGHGLLVRLDGGQLIALLVAGVLGSPLEAVLVDLEDLFLLVELLVLLLVARSRRRVTIAPSSFGEAVAAPCGTLRWCTCWI